MQKLVVKEESVEFYVLHAKHAGVGGQTQVAVRDAAEAVRLRCLKGNPPMHDGFWKRIGFPKPLAEDGYPHDIA